MKTTSFLLLLILLIFRVDVSAQEKPADEQYAIKAKPLLQQCEALKEDEDAAVAKASKEVATADAAGKIRLASELGKSCHKKSTEPLMLLLEDKDPAVRIAAIEALGQLGDAEAIDRLIEMINDPDWRVRFAVGPVLCAFQKQKSSYAALNYLVVANPANGFTEGDVRARGNTILAIHQLRDVSFSRKTLYFLFTLQEQADETVRKLAKETLTALKDTRNGPYELIALLKQSLNPSYRRNCAYWLGQLKIEKGRDILSEVAKNDPDTTVKQTAAEALKLLGPGEAYSSGVTTVISKKTANFHAVKVPKAAKAPTKPKSKTSTQK